MKVLISSVGTRGDVQPAVALARQLRDLGATVRLCVPPNFVDWIAELGFEVRPIGIEMRAPRPGAAPAPVPDLITDQFDVLKAAAGDCDVVVGAGLHQYAARSIAELDGKRYAIAAYAPVSLPSGDLPPPGRPTAADVQQLWADVRRSWNQRGLERVNTNRARLGLRPIADVLEHIIGDRPLLACDGELGPAPKVVDFDVVQTGAWILPDETELPAALAEFLEAGEAPIYLGLGSMPAPESTSAALIRAARSIGRRMVLSRGWAELAQIDDDPDCLVVGDVNHQALFPRVSAVVHHGGAGTTTAAALAGAPQVVAPMFSDQCYWADRVAGLGIGGVSPSVLDPVLLTRALEVAVGPEVEARAKAVAQRISRSGAEVAARLVMADGA